MTRKCKIVHRPTGELFEYRGKFYRAMAIESGEKKVCNLCAFGKPASNDDDKAHGCADHQCELDTEGVFYEEVK